MSCYFEGLGRHRFILPSCPALSGSPQQLPHLIHHPTHPLTHMRPVTTHACTKTHQPTHLSTHPCPPTLVQFLTFWWFRSACSPALVSPALRRSSSVATTSSGSVPPAPRMGGGVDGGGWCGAGQRASSRQEMEDLQRGEGFHECVCVCVGVKNNTANLHSRMLAACFKL